MPAEWALSIAVPIFKRKGEIMNRNCYRAVRHLEHGMKVVKRVLQKMCCRILTVHEMQFGFMSEGKQ